MSVGFHFHFGNGGFVWLIFVESEGDDELTFSDVFYFDFNPLSAASCDSLICLGAN